MNYNDVTQIQHPGARSWPSGAKVKRSSPQKVPKLLVAVFVIAMSFRGAMAQQGKCGSELKIFPATVQLQNAQMNVEDVFVSSNTQVTFEVFKKSNSVPATWQPNLCWELQVESPYRNPEDYQPFSASNPPTCVGLSNGLSVACNLKSGRLDTLQFKFTEISSEIASFNSLRFNFTNF